MVTTVDRTKNINTQNKQTTKNQHPEYQTTKQHQEKLIVKADIKRDLLPHKLLRTSCVNCLPIFYF